MPISPAILAKYLNHTFIETGSYAGDGIQAAIEAGFKRVISIELSERHFIACKCRFEDDSRVRMVYGDSRFELAHAMASITDRCTLWLDGHWSGGDTAGDAEHETPLLAELDAIAAHPVKGHAILIDDAQDWRKEKHGFGLQELMRKLRTMDERYRFWFEKSGERKDGILVARII